MWMLRFSLLISFILIFSGMSSIKADESFDAHSNSNKTVHVPWTLKSTEEHYLRCIADGDGNPKPTLYWTMDLETLTQFTVGNYTTVDVSNPQDIRITFNDINYDIVGDYFCVASNETGKILSFTYFKVLVATPTHKTTVFGALVMLLIFTAGAFIICRVFKVNEGSTKIDL